MADLRIADAPELSTSAVEDGLKVPTGGFGNYSITMFTIADWLLNYKNFATKSYVDNSSNTVNQSLINHVNNTSNPHNVTKAQVGLGNVNNTADLDKPISDATVAALALKADKSNTYTKTEVDNKDNLKADKTYVDTQLILKADKTNIYTKDEVDTTLNAKVNKSVYDVFYNHEKSGLTYQFDSSYVSTYGGYPLGAELVLSDGLTKVVSTVANNTNDPNTDMTGWVYSKDKNSVLYFDTLPSTANENQISYLKGIGFFKYASGGWSRIKLTVADIRAYEPNFNNEVLRSGDNLVGDWFYDASDTTTADNGWFCIVTPSGKRWKRCESKTKIDLGWNVQNNDGGNLATAWQVANDYVTSLSRSMNRLGGVPFVEIPAGRYTMSQGIVLSTITRTKSNGSVILDCSDWTDLSRGNKAIQIRNDFNLNYVRGGFTQQSPYLDGTNGGIHICGAGGGVANITGLWVGNLANGLTPVRGSIATNVSIVNFYKGVEWGRYNLYLQRYFQCQLEGNMYNMYSSNSSQTDSGERNSFVDCVFGVCGANHVYHNTPACDINFENCSFDFASDSSVYTGSQASFCTLKFTDCHFENYVNYLLDGSGADYKNIVFENAIFLKTGGTIGNRVSKPLFSPNINFTGSTSKILVSGYEIRTTERAFNREVFVTGVLNSRNNQNIVMKGCFRDAWGHIPSLRNIKNKSYDFSGETAGADGTTVPFVNFTVKTKSNTNITIDASKRLSLQKTGTSNAYCELVSNSISVDCLSQYGIIPSFIRGSSRGGKINCIIDYYDSANVLLGSSSNFQVSLDPYWNDITAPNFSEGDSRDICLQMQSLSTPFQFAVSAKMRFIISEYTETLLMTSMMFIEFPV